MAGIYRQRFMSDNNLAEHPHRRFNALTGEWVLVSPHRTKRPWQGEQERRSALTRSVYDPECYLCPGNVRANGEKNPIYKSTYVFTNDFTAILPDSDISLEVSYPYIKSEGVQGTCRVICFSPRHDLTLPEMSIEEIRAVIDVWADQILELGKKYLWVQVFENKGEIMGCSNPHPHCQVWAGTSLPNEPYKEDNQQRIFHKENKTVLLLDYLNFEVGKAKRIVVENEYWIFIVPFWAIWPFETILIPKRHILQLPDLSDEERNALSDILKKLLTKYDNLFNVSFPYTMGWHGAPWNDEDNGHWQLHAHFYPPLLRSAIIKKFMVGYEMLSEPQRDITSEQAADRLRELSDIHYKLKLQNG